MPIVSVEGVGNVEFPNTMSKKDIVNAIENDILPQFQKRIERIPKPVDKTQELEIPPQRGLGAAFKKGLAGIVSPSATAVEATLGNKEEAALAGLLRGEETGKKYADQTSLEAVKKAYEDRGLLAAGKEVLSQVPYAIAEQVPNLATAAGGAFAGARLGAFAGLPGATIGGLAGAALGSFLQQYGSNIERQAQVQQEQGKPVDINLGKAAGAATLQAAGDVVEQRLLFGSKIVGKLLGRTGDDVLKMEAAKAEKLAREGLVKTLAAGTAKGVLTEIPIELGQTMLERLQAGLPLTTPDALKEYGDTAYQVGLLGPLGAVGRFSEKGQAREQFPTAPKSDIEQRIQETMPTGDLAARAREEEINRLADMQTAVKMREAGVGVGERIEEVDEHERAWNEALKREAEKEKSPVVGKTKINVGGKESIKTVYKDGSVDIDGVQVIAPNVEQGAVNAQPAGVSGVGGDTTSAAAPVQTGAAEQPAVKPVVPEGVGSAVAAAGPVDAGKVGEQGALTETKTEAPTKTKTETKEPTEPIRNALVSLQMFEDALANNKPVPNHKRWIHNIRRGLSEFGIDADKNTKFRRKGRGDAEYIDFLGKELRARVEEAGYAQPDYTPVDLTKKTEEKVEPLSDEEQKELQADLDEETAGLFTEEKEATTTPVEEVKAAPVEEVKEEPKGKRGKGDITKHPDFPLLAQSATAVRVARGKTRWWAGGKDNEQFRHLMYLIDTAEDVSADVGTKKDDLIKRGAQQILDNLYLPENVLEMAREELRRVGRVAESNAKIALKNKIARFENSIDVFKNRIAQLQTSDKPDKEAIDDVKDLLADKELELSNAIKELKYLNKLKKFVRHGKSPIGARLSQTTVSKLSSGNLKGALSEIAASGSDPLIRTYARKLIAALGDTRVAIYPTKYLGVGNNVAGVYDATNNTVIYDPSALDEHTLLHEATHAAIDHVIDNANHPLTKELQKIYDSLAPALKGQYAVKSLKEFASEAVSNGEFQNILRSMPAVEPKGALRSMWDSFVDAVRRAFGFMGRASQTQMDKVDSVIDRLLQAGAVEPRNVLPTKQELSLMETTIAADAKHAKAGQKIPFGAGLDVGTGKFDDLMNAVNEGIKSRDVGPAAEVLKTIFNSSVKDSFTRALAYTSTAHHIKQMYGEVRSISDTVDHLLSMDGTFNSLLKAADKTHIKWLDLMVKNPAGTRQLHELINAATLVETDPSTAEGRKKNATLAEAWDELGKVPGAQQLYKEIFQFYSDRRDMSLSALLTRVEQSFGERPDFSSMTPEAANKARTAWNETKKRTISGLRHMFERQGVIEPYAPLSRRGEYWIRIGKKSNPDRVFDMSETAYEHEKKLKLYKQMGATDIEAGYGINHVFDNIKEGSTFIKEVVKLVDEADLKGTGREDLMKDIYAAYLELLPEMSMRKHFMPRKGTAGYSPDAFRTFTNFAYHSSRQLARMQHSTAALNSLDSAREAVKELPNKTQLDIVIGALKDRVDNALKPEDPNEPMARLVNGMTNISFYYYLSAPKSALNQMLSVPMMSLPEMSAQFRKAGVSGAAKELASVFGKIAKTGISWKNGVARYSSYTDAIPKFEDIFAEAESIVRKARQQHQREELDPRDRDNLDFFKVLERLGSKVPEDQQENFRLRRAYEELEARNAFDATLSMDFMPSLRNASAAIAKGKTGIGGKLLSFANQASAGLFHAMEKASRETTAMASYNLAIKEGLSHAEAIDKALDVSTRALGNYGKANAQGFMSNKGLKLIGQFKRYPMEMLFYMSKSAFDMVANFHALQFDKSLTPEERETARVMAKAASIRFTGMLGMVGLFAGVSGMPWVVAAALQGASMFGHLDDDDEDMLLRKNKELWFNEWLKQTFNSQAIADIVSYGPVGFALSTDLHSSLSLNDLFFRDTAIRQSPETSSEIQQYLVEMLGPSAGMLVNGGKAWDHFNNGNVGRAIETLLPAGLRNLATARRYLSEGVVTPSGKKVFEQEDIAAVDVFKQMFGYSPEKIALMTRDNIARKGIEVELTQTRTKLLDLYDRAVMNDDYEAEDKIMDKIDEFNDRYPMLEISAKTRAQSLKRKEKDEAGADHGLVLSKKLKTYLGRE